jgi:hypothetical protein
MTRIRFIVKAAPPGAVQSNSASAGRAMLSPEMPTLLIPATLVVERDGFMRARFVDPDSQDNDLKEARNPRLPLRQVCRSELLSAKT